MLGRHPIEFAAVSFASIGVGAVDVDDEWAGPDEGEDDLLGLVARVDVAMNQARRNVEKPARLHVRTFAPARPELEPGAAPEHVPEHISVAVMMPAGGNTARGASAYEHRARRVERELTNETRRRGSRYQTLAGDGSYFLMFASRPDPQGYSSTRHRVRQRSAVSPEGCSDVRGGGGCHGGGV